MDLNALAKDDKGECPALHHPGVAQIIFVVKERNQKQRHEDAKGIGNHEKYGGYIVVEDAGGNQHP